MDKSCIEITEVLDVTEKGVQVIVKNSGKQLWLPLAHTERYGNRIFIPTHLYNKIFEKDAICSSLS